MMEELNGSEDEFSSNLYIIMILRVIIFLRNVNWWKKNSLR